MDATSDKDDDPLLNYKEIAAMLKVAPRTVRLWDRQRLLPRPSFQVLRLRRWHKSVIEAWIKVGGTRGSKHAAEPRRKRETGDKK